MITLVSVAYSLRADESDQAAQADDANLLRGYGLTDLDDRWVNQEDLDHLNTSDGDPANALSVDDAGKVGIGTTCPLTELDVNGSVKATTYYDDGSNLMESPERRITTGLSLATMSTTRRETRASELIIPPANSGSTATPGEPACSTTIPTRD